MEQKLREVQKLLRAIAREGMNADFDMAIEVDKGQWGSWEQERVEGTVNAIELYAKWAKKLLKQVKRG